MGADVGAPVGADVGEPVGAAVGEPVGAPVGASVGDPCDSHKSPHKHVRVHVTCRVVKLLGS